MPVLQTTDLNVKGFTSLYAIVIGCGRAGAEIAGRLSANGHAVVVIDRDRRAFTRLPERFTGTTIVGQAIDTECLISAGIEQADAVITTTYGDNSNLTVAQLARERFGVGRSIARVKDPVRAAIFSGLGVETLSSTELVADAFENALDWKPAADPDKNEVRS